MVGQVVGGAVAPIVVQSAVEEGGLLNTLLKLLTIGAIIAGFVILAVVLVLAFEIITIVGNIVDTGVSFFERFTAPFSIGSSAIAGIGTAITGFASAFFIRR